jgi:hypothetical protein
MSSQFNSFKVQPSHIAGDPKKNKYLVGFEDFTFNDNAEVQAAMQDPRYHSDADFRYAVHVVLGRSNVSGGAIVGDRGALERAMSNREAARKAEDDEILQEQALALFNTDLYRTSPTERRRVRDLIASNQGAVDAALGHRFVDRSLQPGGSVQLGEADLNEIRNGVRKEAADKRQAEAKEAAQAAYDRAMAGDVGTEADNEGDAGDDAGE